MTGKIFSKFPVESIAVGGVQKIIKNKKKKKFVDNSHKHGFLNKNCQKKMNFHTLASFHYKTVIIIERYFQNYCFITWRKTRNNNILSIFT